MCPGGKRHYPTELRAQPEYYATHKTLECPCDWCRYNKESQKNKQRIGELRKALEDAKETRQSCEENRREASRLLRTVRVVAVEDSPRTAGTRSSAAATGASCAVLGRVVQVVVLRVNMLIV